MWQTGHFCDIACKYDDSGCFHPNRFNIIMGYKKVAKFLEEKGKQINELGGEEMFAADEKVPDPSGYFINDCLVENKGEWRTTHIVKLVGYSPSIEGVIHQIEQLPLLWYNWSKETKEYEKQIDISKYSSISQLEEEILYNNRP